MRKRVLIVSTYFPPNDRAGGAEMYALAMASGLRTNYDWEVTVVSTTSKQACSSEWVPDNITVHRLPYRFRLSNSPISITWIWRLRKIIEEVDPDVINIHLPVPGLGDIATFLTHKRPIVLNYHYSSMRKDALAPNLVILPYEFIWLRIVLNKAAQIVCPSGYVREGFLRDFSGKTHVISPAVDIELFHPAARKVIIPRVLYVGTLNRSDRHKRFTDLLEAFGMLLADIPALRLSAVGSGDARQEYEDLAGKMGIGDSVDFHGRLEGEVLAEAYRRSTVLALPSETESFGMVIAEAMACGMPVVSTRTGGVPELVDDGRTGLLVPTRDPKSLAGALRTILTDPEKAALFGRAGSQKVRDRLTWPRQVSLMNMVLMEVIGDYP